MMKKIFLSILVCAVASTALVGEASAFCGFYVGGADAKLYNDATQVTLMRAANTTVLSMQNNYEGPLSDFAMVVPVPQVLQKENVKTLKKSAFDRIDRLTAPRLVEYWEQDPCVPVLEYEKGRGGMVKMAGSDGAIKETGGVKVEAEFSVGEYDIVVLSAKEATGLETWLTANKYVIPKGAAPFFKPYIESGSYFFVAKVAAKRVTYKDGKAVLSPLRFHYSDKKFQLPIRLGMINSKGQQDLLVYILADGTRYEVANYPNVMVPTNVEVNPAVAGQFGGFYEALFARTVEENPKAVVTEYAWSASWCDPCPDGISALDTSDFMTFGADVVPAGARANWVVTRLHMRYGADGVGEDLVFKKGDPASGGREHSGVQRGRLVTADNQFQGRYIIRHEWPNKVECKDPVFGQWGGPWPDAKRAAETAAVSRNTAGSAPTKVNLDGMLAKKEQPPKAPVADSPPGSTEGPPDEPTDAPTEPAPAKAKGCQVTGVAGSTPWFSLGLLGLVGWVRRRRD